MGVKSLWSLLTPVGRPILLETVEGKIMAIDSSIWIYQFQATMRDKDGRALTNAHVLGFLRRISKLLFYGIKPVFVFDGGAPVLKRSTLRERRKKKSGAAADHVKLAEKLLAAQMRREALGRAHPGEVSVTVSKGKAKVSEDQMVYLEDIDPSIPKTPARSKLGPPASTSARKNKFYDHDPYRLPDIDVEEATQTSRSAAPDPRLATEEELRAFIEDMRPEDFDVTSPAFRELPTEVQYEIVGDLRLKSRQTSYARLQNMLKSAPTPLDFSKQQILNLRQRNTLTQQLLITTDSIGSAHISIPVRIASERNKEYVLMKNEGDSGGWILGIRDDGTKQKPIEIDQVETPDLDDDSEDDMEEVPISTNDTFDTDLREYQRHMALSAIGNRTTKQPPLPKTSNPRGSLEHALGSEHEMTQPLFYDSGDDDELLIAIQASLEGTQNKQVSSVSQPPPHLSPPSSIAHPTQDAIDISSSPPISNDILISHSRLETALSIANAGPSRSHGYFSSPKANSKSFGRPLLLASQTGSMTPLEPAKNSGNTNLPIQIESTRQDTISLPPNSNLSNSVQLALKTANAPHSVGNTVFASDSHQMESRPHFDPQDDKKERVFTSADNILFQEVSLTSQSSNSTSQRSIPQLSDIGLRHLSPVFNERNVGTPVVDRSRSSSPPNISSVNGEFLANYSVDDGEELDPSREESEFARFISEVKGKDIEDVRREIDDEIQSLDRQRKAAIRDSEDITQQMISQIMTMLRLFGIPYITAPMEAEAQCAELVSLGLVDGVITDDSDVFLFGAQRVFKNMFNQSKTVECFLLSDLSRELGLERDDLIRLAYLLGSDYVDGLPGVGPVVAMELLKEFPGEDGLHNFKDWWSRVQTGKDKEDDNNSKFRAQFKRKFKNLYLAPEWPNPAVKDAYYHPTVDSSDEPFKWGIPDLDALRSFLLEELGWGQVKTDEVLLPIIQRMNKRRGATALNKQSNLGGFFDINVGSGSYAPHKRQAHTSKRLQRVVNDFRSKRKRDPSPPASLSSPSDFESETVAQKKKKTKTKATKGKRK